MPRLRAQHQHLPELSLHVAGRGDVRPPATAVYGPPYSCYIAPAHGGSGTSLTISSHLPFLSAPPQRCTVIHLREPLAISLHGSTHALTLSSGQSCAPAVDVSGTSALHLLPRSHGTIPMSCLPSLSQIPQVLLRPAVAR